MTTDQHLDRLEKGWVWLGKHPNHRAYEEKFAHWERWLRAYERHMQGGTG